MSYEFVISKHLKTKELTRQNGKEAVIKYNDYLANLFYDGLDIFTLSKARSEFIDQLITVLFHQFKLNNQDDLTIVAVGGYGRRELHPYTDIDILVVVHNELKKEIESQLRDFITLLWDFKLEIGHSVRTIEECFTYGNSDITIGTNLIESRFICGNTNTYKELLSIVNDKNFWPISSFFQAKLEEQNTRHKQFQNTMYMLEPDLKNMCGGLRDIQTILWIAKKYIKVKNFDEMVSLGFLTSNEKEDLESSEYFLWRVRFALQNHIKRNDNRLTFDRQIAVAKILGFLGEGNVAVENFMLRFYQATRRISELNEMLLQLFQEAIYGSFSEKEIKVLNNKFILKGTLIDTIDHDLFINDPSSILELFNFISEISTTDDSIIISGLYPTCIRNIRRAKRELNYYLIENRYCRELFIKIISNPNSLILTMNLMHKHNIVSIYLQEWVNLVGQMQFDMFHVYTVDEHIYRTMKCIFDFSHSKKIFLNHSLFRNIYHNLNKPSLLYISAFLHDITKGRHDGISHAISGAEFATSFCQLHNLTPAETRLISWLVLHHLDFSTTALRRDISDPTVIQHFANTMQDEQHLNYLYCLTVADICATNDNIWNNWKESIFRTLYYSTLNVLRQGVEKPLDWNLSIKENKEEALSGLIESGNQKSKILELWNTFPEHYFIHHSSDQIFWHTNNIINKSTPDNIPLVLFGQSSNNYGTELFIYAQEVVGIFCKIVSILGSRNISIIQASILNSSDNHIMDTFLIVDSLGHPISPEKLMPLQKLLLMNIPNENYQLPQIKNILKKYKQFKHPTSVKYLNIPESEKLGITHVEISSIDRPGLLADISYVFQECNINIKAARIATTGERADDGFSISTQNGTALTEKMKETLKIRMIDYLDQKLTEES